MANKNWERTVLAILAKTGELGKESAEFILENKVRLHFKKYSKSTGARWFLFKQISLNTRYFSLETVLDDPNMLSLFVHEVHHLKQGAITALSVFGELDAWQVGYRFYKSIRPVKLHPALEEMLTLPLNWDRAILRRAATLMQDYAGKGYHSDWLPLYPIHKEIAYWLTRREPLK
jgi:hypothetical protein